MQGTPKYLKALITRKRIDAFIKQYENMANSNNEPKDEQLHAEYVKWKAKIAHIETLTREASTEPKQWTSHSTRQITTSIKRGSNKFQIKCKLNLHSGYEQLYKLIANPNAIQELLPFCQSVTDLKTYDDLEKDVLIRFKIPFVNERCIASHLLLLDRIQQKGTVLIYGQEIQNEQIQKQFSKQNVMKVKAFVCEMTIGVKEYVISTYANLDGPMSFIPDFVLKKVLHLANTIIIANISKIIKKGQSRINDAQPSELEERLRLRYLGRL